MEISCVIYPRVVTQWGKFVRVTLVSFLVHDLRHKNPFVKPKCLQAMAVNLLFSSEQMTSKGFLAGR